MYSVGEEFERLVEEDLEYLTCISNVTIGDKEYLICENENGTKRLFYYDTVEENLELLEEEEADEVLEVVYQLLSVVVTSKCHQVLMSLQQLVCFVYVRVL